MYNLDQMYEQELVEKFKNTEWEKYYIIGKTTGNKMAMVVPLDDLKIEKKATNTIAGGWNNVPLVEWDAINSIIFTGTVEGEKIAIRMIEPPTKEITENEFLNLINTNLEDQEGGNNEH